MIYHANGVLLKIYSGVTAGNSQKRATAVHTNKSEHFEAVQKVNGIFLKSEMSKARSVLSLESTFFGR